MSGAGGLRNIAIVVVGLVVVMISATQTVAQIVEVADLNRQISDESRRGLVDEKAGRYDLAIAAFTHVIALSPNDADAYAGRGVAEDQKGLYDRAIADYTRAIALAAGAAAAETYFNRGAAYEHRRLFERALADYRTALGLDPSLKVAEAGVKRLGAGR